VAEDEFNHCFVSDTIVESRLTTSTRGICYVFPLYLYDISQKVENISEEFRKNLTKALGIDTPPTGRQILYYIYAVLFSTVYRKEYATHLRFDFPRMPFPSEKKLFLEMSELG
jgi:predicted helicase